MVLGGCRSFLLLVTTEKQDQKTEGICLSAYSSKHSEVLLAWLCEG